VYKKIRRKDIEDRILSKYGISWDEYKKAINEGKLTEIYYRIIGQIEDYKVDFIALIAGVDDEGAHIFLIEDPGDVSSFDDIGYTAIGSGEYHAIRSFIESNYSVDFPLEKALYVVYEAKKYAECAPGVGKETELVIIDKNGIFKINNIVKNALNEAYDTKWKNIQGVIKEKLDPRISDIRQQLQKLLERKQQE